MMRNMNAVNGRNDTYFHEIFARLNITLPDQAEVDTLGIDEDRKMTVDKEDKITFSVNATPIKAMNQCTTL